MFFERKLSVHRPKTTKMCGTRRQTPGIFPYLCFYSPVDHSETAFSYIKYGAERCRTFFRNFRNSGSFSFDFVSYFFVFVIFTVKCQNFVAICTFYYQNYPFTFRTYCATIYLVRVANEIGNVFHKSPIIFDWSIYKETKGLFCILYIKFTFTHKTPPHFLKIFSTEVITKWHRKFSL